MKERLEICLPAGGDEAAEQDAELQRDILIINPSHNRPELCVTYKMFKKNQNYQIEQQCQNATLMYMFSGFVTEI